MIKNILCLHVIVIVCLLSDINSSYISLGDVINESNEVHRHFNNIKNYSSSEWTKAPITEVKNIVVEFRLFSRKNPVIFQRIEPGEETKTYFNILSKTIFVVHGWGADSLSPYILSIKDGLLHRWDCNVIMVDWSQEAIDLYPFSRIHIYQVAKIFTGFMQYLVESGHSFEKMYAVGHSLGAHVAGLAAKNLQGGRISGIVGLDPALPLFSIWIASQRLSKGDASVVQVIHTNGGRLGISKPIGDVDFFPNGGKKQPSCNFDILGGCSHLLAVTYFVESLKTPENYPAVRCANFEEILIGLCTDTGVHIFMGELDIPASLHGVYWLKISA